MIEEEGIVAGPD